MVLVKTEPTSLGHGRDEKSRKQENGKAGPDASWTSVTTAPDAVLPPNTVTDMLSLAEAVVARDEYRAPPRPPERAGRCLRVGVLSDGTGLPAWMTRALETLSPDHAAIEHIYVLPPPRQASGGTPPWLFRKFHAWSRSGASDVFAAAGWQPAGVPKTELQGGQSGAALSPEDRGLIARHELDVLLWAAAPLAGDASNLARLGVWSMALGEPEYATYLPPWWREVYEERSVSRGFLLVHPERLDRGRVVDSFALTTTPSLRFTRNQAAPLKAVCATLNRGLAKAAVRQSPPAGGHEMQLCPAAARWPSSLETLSFVGSKLARNARLRAEARNKSMRWVVAIRPAAGLATVWRQRDRQPPFVELAAPPGHYYADPFVVEHAGKHWLFVEDWIDSHNRAVLTCLELRGDGSAGEPVVVLDKPYHLSYPHVFSHDGDFFMIPESFESSTVQLYRATRFPHEWTLEALLAEGEQYVDTTPFLLDGTWYFFTSTHAEPEEARIFTSDRLDGRWQPHPANPIATDVRSLRGAGAIVPWRGNLVRPAQDCSLGYGYGVTFNQIRRLSRTEYEEHQIGKLLPDWGPRLCGTHTYNSNSKFEVVDGRRLTPNS